MKGVLTALSHVGNVDAQFCGHETEHRENGESRVQARPTIQERDKDALAIKKKRRAL